MKRLMIIVAAALIAAPALCGQPFMAFEKDKVTVDGVSAGARVALYGVAHDFQAVLPELLRWAREVTDDDRDGVVVLTIPREVPRDSQWFAVDLSTGEMAAASPRGDDPREVPFDGPGVVDSHASPRTAIRVRHAVADVLVARCGGGGGSWLLLAGDGAEGDADATPDGIISGELASFRSVGRAPASPAAFARGDIAIVVDPLSLQYSILALQER